MVAERINAGETMDPPTHILKYFDLNHGVGKGPAWIKKNQKQSSFVDDYET